jgi:CheY-like chemotaxis protein
LARTVLLADDSVTAQNMGRRILVDAGYEVITVNNGSSALKKITEEKPDLIVLDVYMPGYGGLEVCQRIREAPETARIPVLLTVGKLEPFKADEARRVRADAFIVKPFEASELLTALTNLEDKIVAQPTSTQRGQHLRTEAPAEPTKDFGDKDRGWRSRLRIPVRGKSRDGEAAPDSGSSASEEYYEVKLRGAESAQQPTEGNAVAASTGAEALKAEPQDGQGLQAGPALEPKLPPPVIGEERNTTEAQATPSAPAAAGDAGAQGGQKSVEDEVAAVLATIPDNAKGAATMAATAAQPQPTGPRWIADSVALTKDESSLVLEQEMEKVTASAAVGVDAARSILSHCVVSSLPTEGSIPQETKLPPQPEKPAPADDTVKAQEAPVAASSSEPVGETAAPQPEASDQNAKEVQAYAAHASAGVGAESQGASNQAAPPSQPSVTAKPPAIIVESKESPAAAVEHLLAGSVTPELTSELVVAAQSTVSQATEAGTSDDAITSIVDKVLAELKPKLIEEIAKKIKKDNQ